MSGAKQVGILAAEIYFPAAYVDQRDLEKHDGQLGVNFYFVKMILLVLK